VSFFRSVFNAVFPAKTTPKQSTSTHEMKKEKSKEILKRSKSSDCEIILNPKYGETSAKEEKRQSSGEKICKIEETKGVEVSQKKQPRGYATSSSPREYTEIKRSTDAHKEKESSSCAEIFMRAAREQKKSSAKLKKLRAWRHLNLKNTKKAKINNVLIHFNYLEVCNPEIFSNTKESTIQNHSPTGLLIRDAHRVEPMYCFV
jgi:hypothetical protein